MKRLIPIVLLMAAMAGCATSQMKSTPFYSGSERVYTGKPEDRVNLWPFAYYRDPALSVLWPIYSQTDDHLAVRPIYSQFRQGGKDSGYDEFNFLWPLCQFDTRHHDHRVFPAFWGDRHFDLFPLVWWRFDRSFTLFPLWWSNSRRNLLLPFYYQDGQTICIYPFYGRSRQGDRFTEWYGPGGRHRGSDGDYDWCFPFYYRDATSFETPLFGWDRNDRSAWVFPFYYKDHSGFVSLPWMSGQDKDSSWWVIPPLLSWGESGEEEWFQRYLFGLSGISRGKDGDYADWLLPLYYRDEQRFITPILGHTEKASWLLPFYYSDNSCFVTPFIGKVKAAHWAFPLYYKDEERFFSLLLSWRIDSYSNRYYSAPALLSWYERRSSGKVSARLFIALAGWKSNSIDGVFESWLFPLYGKDRDMFLSLPFGHGRNFTYVTPLFGVVHKEHEKGAWLWPLFGWTNDDRMEAAEAQVSADRLDQKIAVEKHETVYSKGHTNRWYEVTGGIRANDSSWRLSGLSTSDRWISWYASDDGKVVTAKDRSDFGNIFAYKSENCREVKFDAKTREKLSDEENGESGIFCNLFWHSKHEAKNGHEYDMKSILWRFWHYEKLNGDVTVDSFPFFTYDSKTNGYSKASLLWRLFRNEYDPKTDRRAIDFLFIPIWR